MNASIVISDSVVYVINLGREYLYMSLTYN